jgi:hypothetical protein
MSRLVNYAVTALEILRSSFRVVQAVDSRLAPRRADLEILGIDPTAFAAVTRARGTDRRPVRAVRAPGLAHA